METSSLPAQYGVHPSGAVNAITKSGTNRFHGDAFEYVRNYMFDSKNTAYDSDGVPYFRDNLKRNQFGGTIGGPIKKDKLFFFARLAGHHPDGPQIRRPRLSQRRRCSLETSKPCLGHGPGPWARRMSTTR